MLEVPLMNARILSAIFLSLAITGANAQTDPAKAPPAEQTKPAAEQAKPATPPPAPAAQRPAREQTPDQKALADANKITDPAKKIEALDKFKKDFPDSNMVGSATMNIFSTMAQKMPNEKKRIRTYGKAIYLAEKDKKKQVSMVGQMADTLLSANVLLKEAEKYANISLNAMDQAGYLKDQQAVFERRKTSNPEAKPTPEADLIKRFKDNRASRVATLGRIEFKLGKNAAAQKLLEESYGVNANQPLVAGALGEMAARTGDNAKALDYLIPAKLSGRAPATANETLSLVYMRTHNGSTNGIKAMVDTEHHKRVPQPLSL